MLTIYVLRSSFKIFIFLSFYCAREMKAFINARRKMKNLFVFLRKLFARVLSGPTGSPQTSG